MSKRNILLIFLFFIGLLGFLFISFYNEAKQERINHLNAEQLLHARQAARGIEDSFANWTQILTIQSESNHIKDLDKIGEAAIENLYKSNQELIRAVTRVDANGRIIYTIPYDRSAIGRDISSQKHISEIMKTRKPVISDVFFAVQGYSIIALHVPVFNDKTYLGSIAVGINFQSLAKRYLESIKIGETGYAWIISRDGTELFCPVPGHIGNSVFENCKNFPSILTMAEDMLKGHEGTAIYSFDKIRGDTVEVVKKHAVYMPIPIGNTYWSIVVASSEDEVISSLKDFRNRLLVIIGVLLLGGGLFFYYGLKALFIIREEEKRKRAEEALRANRTQLMEIIDFLPDATLVIDKERRIVIWNKAIERMTGIPASEMIGKGNFAYTIPFYGELRPSLMDLIFEDSEEIKARYPAINREGDTIIAEAFCNALYGNKGAWVFAKASPLHDPFGNIVGAIESIRDITDRKRVEESLCESEANYRSIFDLANDAIFVHELETGRILDVNAKMTEMFGYTREEALQIDVGCLGAGEPPYTQKYALEWIRKAIEEGPQVFEWKAKDKTGRVFWEETSLNLAKIGGNDRLLAMVRDITERKQAEEEKRNMMERLSRAEKMEALGTLAGGVAHDLNNVLGIVVGYAELLLDEVEDSSSMREDVERILNGGKRAAAMVDDMLTMARRGVHNRQILNLNKIIMDGKKSSEFMHLSPQLSSVELNDHLDPDLLNISGSPVHLTKSLYNLILNASEAMPNGGVLTIKTANQYLDKPVQGYSEIMEGDYVVLSVSDTGEGIKAADLKRIFEPFYTKKIMGKSGTGLGLSVVWSTVKDHNGYIDVQSEEGKGSAFTLYFPVSREEITAEQVAVSIAEYMGKGESILIVDDVKGQRDLATGMLKKLNYNVSSVSSGEEAVEYLKEHKVDLLVLDMIMEPGMDGLDTYKSVLEIRPKQKAIIVSGFSETDRVDAAQALGAGAYVKKPYVIEKLGMAVRKELDRK